ncbi:MULTISPECIES: GxxExxY protein [Chryseobacterium]|uniref:GxxExxY protein n=1 Tax=Chryseobacterium rhizosphaerae TaxID=395937 RepID=A0AAE4C233_9FLAO|nr:MULTISPECIES: GxxExxY protein [Chryseobacterium]MBL3549216.1 GxxExxY protein [Chryseobacterium sp. KMC2]MDC8100480.1 GxxExxY protein [Chryseobacterium rhizosphaerae]MDR6525377.1 GxxExxY protein [Chryseobacterium rhizosphaerae]SMC38747.1 GxxExxY protein [Chryseobacterium sp. YR221]
MTENELSRIVFDMGLKIHKKLGAGLFEHVYEECMFYELTKAGLLVEKQKLLPIVYEDLRIENAFRLDIIIENKLILEIKTVDYINPTHKAQLLTYLKMTNCKLGLLLNFQSNVFKDGVTRVVNHL